MPEISQDAFEILNPGCPPISSTELRSRSNSIGLKSPRLSLTSAPDFATALKENLLEINTIRERSATFGEQDMDQSIINGLSALDVSHKYKRELDHR